MTHDKFETSYLVMRDTWWDWRDDCPDIRQSDAARGIALSEAVAIHGDD